MNSQSKVEIYISSLALVYPGHPKTSVAQVVIPMTFPQLTLKPVITTDINLALKPSHHKFVR